MLKRLQNAAVIALAACFAMGFGAEVWRASDSPRPSIDQSAAAQKQRGANPYTQKETPEEAIARYNKWLAIFTAILATATVGLGIATIGLYFAGERQLRLAKETANRQAVEIQNQIDIAREANRAAQKSADAAVAAERARLYVSITHNFLDCINAASAWENTPTVDETPLSSSSLPMAKIRFKNYGKTPSIVAEVGAGIVYSETVPDPVWDVKVVKDNIIGADQCTEEFTEVITGQMTLGMAKNIRDGAANIWIYGYASYDDVFGERQTHRFFQRFVRVGHYRYVLQAYDYKHYNYST